MEKMLPGSSLKLACITGIFCPKFQASLSITKFADTFTKSKRRPGLPGLQVEREKL